MRFYNGDLCEVILTPTNSEMEAAINAAKSLMAIKVNQWILDQLTMEQLETCLQHFQAEIAKRRGGP